MRELYAQGRERPISETQDDHSLAQLRAAGALPSETELDALIWLEGNGDEVDSFDARQNERTDGHLGQWPDRERLRARFCSQLKGGEAQGRPLGARFGAREFYLRQPDGAGHSALFVSDDQGERLLVDPVEHSGPESTLDWFHPSPSGNLVAYGVSRLGDEQSVLHVIQAQNSTDTGIAVPHVSFGEVAWLPGEEGFYFGGGVASDHVDANKRLFFLPLEEGRPREAEPIDLGDPFVHPQLSESGRYLTVTRSWEKPQVAFYRDLQAGDGWRPFLGHLDGETFGAFGGDTFYVLSTAGAPRGRILAIPMEHAEEPERWTELVPEGSAVLRSVQVVADRLILVEVYEGSARLRLVSLEDGSQTVIEPPGVGMIAPESGNSTPPLLVRGDEVAFRWSQFERPSRTLRLDLATLRLSEANGAPAREQPSNFVVRRGSAPTKDGKLVPYFLVHAAGLEAEEPRPTLIYGYGGWNLPAGPRWLGAGGAGVLPFLEAGGLYVSAALRGGSELGRDWWMDGRREAKQNTYDDLYAVTEHLIAQGIADPQRVAVRGRSNGGLLTAVAVTQRPDLFTAVVSEVPLTDMLRGMEHPYLASYKVEYGDPDDPRFHKILRAYSPVHNVRKGTEYPATLILSARHDLRCQPWHGRKLAALMQEATTASEPILLRIAPGGHGAGLTDGQWTDRNTDVIGFLMQQLGMRLAPEAGAPEDGASEAKAPEAKAPEDSSEDRPEDSSSQGGIS